VLPFHSQQLGLQGLACLAATSKQLRNASLGLARNHALMLVAAMKTEVVAATAAAAAAAAAECVSGIAAHTKPTCWLCTQHMHAITWLLHHAPNAAKAAGMAECAVQIPSVPLIWAKQLVAAGMHVSDAHSMVAGVEVWVVAQQQLDVQRDIPAAAVNICDGD
jgi:hypothetical protein